MERFRYTPKQCGGGIRCDPHTPAVAFLWGGYHYRLQCQCLAHPGRSLFMGTLSLHSGDCYAPFVGKLSLPILVPVHHTPRPEPFYGEAITTLT